jgi:ABC-2 type transport system ATP-binding protein
VTLAQPLTNIPATLEGKVKLNESARLELVLDRGTDTIISVIDSLRDAGAEIIDLRTEEADLEDVFIEITGSA